MPDAAQSDGRETISYTMNTWNLARSIASDCVGIIQEAQDAGEGPIDRSMLETLVEENATYRDVWPFTDADDLLALSKEATDIQADNIATDEIALSVSARIQDSEKYVYVHNPDEENEGDQDAVDAEAETDNSTANDDTAKAQTGGSVSETGEDTQENTKDDSVETATKSHESADENAVKDQSGSTHDEISETEDKDGSESESHKDSNAIGSDVETLSVAEINAESSADTTPDPTFGNKPSGSRADGGKPNGDGSDDGHDMHDTAGANDPEYDVSQRAEDIAHKLYQWVFDEDADVSFKDIDNEYDVPFPKLQTALVEVRNSRGDTAQTRINDIAGWVQWWIDDPEERIDRANQFVPEPMGKPQMG